MLHMLMCVCFVQLQCENSDLAGSTCSSLSYHGWVRDIITQAEICSSTGEFTVVQFHLCCQNLCIGIYQRAITAALTLDSTTLCITGTKTTLISIQLCIQS